MSKKFFDSSIEAVFITFSSEYKMSFSCDWKIPDIISWMKDNYYFDDDDIVEYTISFVRRYKLNSSK